MRHSTRRLTVVASVCVMLGAGAIGFAQDAAPARETPRPQDIDPAVNTSAMPADTGNATSSSTPAEAAKGDASARPGARGAAGGGPSGASAATSPSASSTISGASASSTVSGSAAARTAAGKPGADAKTAAAEGKPKGKAQDRLELDTTQITGNRELPKVLYIVPWKRSDLGDLVGKPVNSLLDEVLTPVDRDVFKRENRYYRALTPAEGQPAGAAGAPESGTAPNAATSTGSVAPAARDER